MLDDIIQGIVTQVKAVPGIGVVLDYARYTPEQQRQEQTYVSNGILNAWVVDRESTKASFIAMGPVTRSLHKITIDGYLAIQTAPDSKKTLQALAEAVASQLNSNASLGAGTLVSPVEVGRVAPMMFLGTVGVWHAPLIVTAQVEPMGIE